MANVRSFLRVRTARFHTLFFARLFSVAVVALCLIALTAPSAWAWPTWREATSAGGRGNTIANGVTVAPDGSQYVTGQFDGTTNFSGTSVVSDGGLDIFLAKYGPAGNLLWVVDCGGTQDDASLSASVDQDGNAYIAGYSLSGSILFGSTDGKTKTVSATSGTWTVFLAKYSPAGVLLWVQAGTSSTGYGINQGFGVTVNPATGTVYLTGIEQSSMSFSSSDGTQHPVNGGYFWHMFLVKYDTNGLFYWGEINAAQPNSIGTSVAVDVDDNAYVAGWMEDTVIFYSHNGKNITVTGFSPAQTTPDYPGDAFLAKYDTNGNVHWVNHIGGYKANGMGVAVHEGIITLVGAIGNINYGSSGEATTIVTSQPPGANINLGGGSYTNPYNPDAVIATYNKFGVLKNALRLGGSEIDTADSVAYDAGGGLFVGGFIQNEGAKPNLILWKYAGTRLLWQETAINATLGSLAPGSPALAVDTSGENVFVAGGFQGTAQFGKFTLTTATGATDMFLAKEAPPPWPH